MRLIKDPISASNCNPLMAGGFVNDEIGRLPVERFGHCLNLGTACNMPRSG